VIGRRTFLAGTGAVCAADAQQAAKIFKVGELHPGIGSEERLAVLRGIGYVEARTGSSNAGTQRDVATACRRSQRAGRPEAGRHSRDG
jgi:hypothetical protein